MVHVVSTFCPGCDDEVGPHVRASTTLNFTILAILALPVTAWPAPTEKGLERVSYGEDALSFASGSILHSLPVDGKVSRITGDNQTTGNKRLLGWGEVTYLTLREPDQASPGDLFTLYRGIYKVFHPSDRRNVGTLFKVFGVVKVVEAGQNPVTVKIVRSYGAILPGDPAMRFVPPPPPAPLTAREPIEGEGMIVSLSPDRTLTASQQIVYIDWGHAQRIRRGDILEVFRRSEVLPKRVIGQLQVLGVGEHISSALVVHAKYHYLKSDRFSFKEPARRVTYAEAEEPFEIVQETIDKPSLVTSDDLTADREMEEIARVVVEGLVDQLEFDSGKVSIKPQGAETLKRVGEILKDAKDMHVRIEGHTDNVEIGPTLTKTYPTNWELSQARAETVMRYFVDTAGLEAKNLSAVGYADTQPVASNASEPDRAKNRRVEIVVYASNPAAPPPGNSPSPEPEAGIVNIPSDPKSDLQGSEPNAAEPQPVPQGQSVLPSSSPAPASSPADPPHS